MERLARLRARIGSVEELRDVAHTMRALAAVRMRQADEALSGARAYAAVVGAALADALALIPPHERLASPRRDGRGLLVFGSENGFVGALNEVVVDHAAAALGEGDRLFVVGSRATRAARERGLDVDWALPMTSRRDSVPTVARQIAAALYRRFEAEQISRLDMMFAEVGGPGQWTCRRQSLLPLDPAAFQAESDGASPVHYLPAPRLVDLLVEEYFFAELTRGAMEAFAGENTARVAAMSAAHDNIERRLGELKCEEDRLRQEEITTELIDVVTGSEALLHPRP
ncbi:MAG: F0F1 ATP synthase subunit gamma [Rhodospirillales bacterium]